MLRNLKLRFALIAALVLLSFWYLVPTIRLYSMTPAEREALARTDPEALQKLREKAIKLGLDLQGGMHLVLEIDETDPQGLLLKASFAGARQPLTDGTLLRALFAYPLMTLKVTAAIHWEALKLWAKGVPVFRHARAASRVATTVVD